MTRRTLIGRLSCAGAACLGTLMAITLWNSPAQAATAAATVDGQEYVSDAPVDPYQNDQAAIHVGVAPNSTETSRSFIHVDVNSLLAQGQVTALTLTLVPAASTSGNLAPTTVALQACALTQPIPAPFDSTKPPAFDCTLGSADGKSDGQGNWTFDLAPLVQFWLAHGDTGAAILPSKTVAATDSWTVAFDRAKTAASAQIVANPVPTPGSAQAAPAAPAATATPPAAGPALSAPIPAPVLPAVTAPSVAATAAPAAPTAAAAAPASIAAPAAQTAAAPQATTPSGRLPGWWPYALVGLVALLLLGLSSLAVQGSGGLLLRVPSLSLVRANAAGLSRSPLVAGIPSGAVIAIVVMLGFTTLAPAQTAIAGQNSGTDVAALPSGDGAAGGEGGSSGALATPSASAGAAGTGAAGAGGVGGATVGTAGAGNPGSHGGSTSARPTAGGTAASSVRLYRGVTATTITIGVVDNTDSGSTLGASGLGAAAIGDGKAQANAVLKDLNAHGGIAGHTVQPAFHDVATADLASDPSGSGEKACLDLSSQNVFAAVVPISITDANTLACFAQHDIPVIVDNTSGYDTAELNQFLSYMYVPSAMSLTRAARTMVTEFASAGYLNSGGVYGVVAPDLPEYHRAYEQGLIPALQAKGITVKDKLVYSTSGGQSQTDFQNGALNFFSENIDHVISLGKQSQISFFMIQADKQQYRPRYGLSSFDNPQLLETLAPKAQLTNAVGAGWNPVLDNDTSHSVQPINANAKRCSDDMNASNVSNSTGNAVAAAFETCDVFFFLQSALTSPSQLSSAGLLQAVNGLGGAYQAPNTFQVVMGQNKHDGASAVRDFGFDGSCSCFLYRGGNRSAS